MFILYGVSIHVLFLGQPSAFWNIIIYTIYQQTGAVPFLFGYAE
jgi:hypothetical protein